MDTPLPSSPWESGAPDHATSRLALRQRLEGLRDRSMPELCAARGLGPYRGYAEMLQEIDRLAHSGARLSQIGRSVRGEPLFSLRVGADEAPTKRPSGSTARDARTTVIVAGLHPIEWIGIETLLALLRRVCEAPPENRAVVAIPIGNPDGLLRVEHNLRRGRHRFVRHNARGVDLNRNFDARWGHRGLLSRLVPWVFRAGSHAASEPEVAAIAYALAGRRVDRSLSLHSFGGVVLYPSAHSILPVADADEHRRWAERIGRQADGRAYRALPSSWFGLGATMGGLELDWFHERHGALSLLVECSRGGLSLRPSRLLEPFAWFNPPRPHDIAERIAEACLPFVRGEPL